MKNTTLCYLIRDDRWLMLHRTKKPKDMNEGKWIGVGGKIEENESPEECLLREVWEETGLQLTRWRYRGIVTFVSDLWEGEYMHLFTADGFAGTMGACDEGQLQWIPREEIPRLPQWEGDRIFLDLLYRDAPFFSLKLSYQGDTLAAASLDGKPLDISFCSE